MIRQIIFIATISGYPCSMDNELRPPKKRFHKIFKMEYITQDLLTFDVLIQSSRENKKFVSFRFKLLDQRRCYESISND